MEGRAHLDSESPFVPFELGPWASYSTFTGRSFLTCKRERMVPAILWNWCEMSVRSSPQILAGFLFFALPPVLSCPPRRRKVWPRGPDSPPPLPSQPQWWRPGREPWVEALSTGAGASGFRVKGTLCLLTWLIVPVSDNCEEATLKKNC